MEQIWTYVGHLVERLKVSLAFQTSHEAVACVGVFVLGCKQSKGDRDGR